jgi:hypothetical protein
MYQHCWDVVDCALSSAGQDFQKIWKSILAFGLQSQSEIRRESWVVKREMLFPCGVWMFFRLILILIDVLRMCGSVLLIFFFRKRAGVVIHHNWQSLGGWFRFVWMPFDARDPQCPRRLCRGICACDMRISICLRVMFHAQYVWCFFKDFHLLRLRLSPDFKANLRIQIQLTCRVAKTPSSAGEVVHKGLGRISKGPEWACGFHKSLAQPIVLLLCCGPSRWPWLE